MNWLKRIFFPPPDPSLAVFEVAVKYAFAETGKRVTFEDELDSVKEELVQAVRDRDLAQSGWLTCRVCGATGEVHTCDYCHAARCRERDEARRERDEARVLAREGWKIIKIVACGPCLDYEMRVREHPWLAESEP